MTVATRLAVSLSLCLLSLVPLRASPAQSTLGEMRRQASRAELEAIATAAESAANAATDQKSRARLMETAAAVRQRLRDGDFVPGDRILLQVLGDTVLSDTFTVRADRMMLLPNLPEIPLRGILDSELSPYMKSVLGKYLRNIEVQTTTLIRVAVLGSIGRPGFYTLPAEQAFSDVLTSAGGLTGSSDIAGIVVRRAGKDVIGKTVVQDAIAKGKTVGDLALRDGDQIVIPALVAAGTPKWQQYAAVLGSLTGLFWIIRYGTGRGRP